MEGPRYTVRAKPLGHKGLPLIVAIAHIATMQTTPAGVVVRMAYGESLLLDGLALDELTRRIDELAGKTGI